MFVCQSKNLKKINTLHKSRTLHTVINRNSLKFSFNMCQKEVSGYVCKGKRFCSVMRKKKNVSICDLIFVSLKIGGWGRGSMQ